MEEVRYERGLKALLALLALFFSSMIYAQPACWPSTVGGLGTKPVMKVTDNGAFVGWWCPTLTTWDYVYSIGLPGYELKHPEKKYTSMTDLAKGYWLANVALTGAGAGAGPRYQLVMNEISPAMNAVKPPDPVWKVAALASGSRPTYKVDKLKLIDNPSQRATVGALCDCKTLNLVQGPSTYCEPAPLKGVVTLCRKE